MEGLAVLEAPSFAEAEPELEQPLPSHQPRDPEETLMDVVLLRIAEAARPFKGRSQWPERLWSSVELRLVEEAALRLAKACQASV